MRVLIADDVPGVRRLLTMSLGDWGYEVVVCADGAEALRILLDDDPPRLAVLDWRMPHVSGPEICRRIRQRAGTPYIYILLLTALGDEAHVVHGLQAGADDYLVKPFEARELRCRLAAGRRVLRLEAELVAGREALRVEAAHDSLTGLWNRRAIVETLERELARGARQGTAVAVIMADLDHFKRINDSHGHPAGDAVLREATRRMSGVVRAYDAIGRYGGEEFLVVCSGADERAAKLSAERLRQSMEREPFEVGGTRITVTLSLGVASTGAAGETDALALIQAADAALYRAKRGGRNRVEVASDRPAESPVAPGPEASHPVGDAEASTDEPPAPLVVVADDDPEIRELLCEALQEAGFRTLAAADGEQALELALEQQPALIVLDVMMPNLDGYTTLTRLRGHPATRDVPVIVLTGQSHPLYRTLSLGVGAMAHMTKPFVPRQLTDLAQRLLGERPA
jgi:diguanylate cyclase (GGDEF)-like protein